MPSIATLSIAMSGLRAQQQAMDITAHNVANASTPGYHRQEVLFMPGAGATSQVATGVAIQTIKRLQSDYVDQQTRTLQSWLGCWEYSKETLQQVEAVLSEPGGLGLSTYLSRFTNAWEALSAAPNDESAKDAVVEAGIALTDRFHALFQSFRDIQSGADRGIVDNASQINQLAHEVAALNEQIGKAAVNAYPANDLMDQRDALLDKLSNLAGVQIFGMSGAEPTVCISGKALVQGTHVNEITVQQGANGWSELVWAEGGSPVEITGGQIAGQIQIRDEVVAGYIEALDQIAGALASGVNALHSTGTTADGSPAGNFFSTGATAASIQVEVDASGIATSVSGEPGDNGLAIEIAAALKEDPAINGEYSRLVGTIGTDSREAMSRVNTYDLSLKQLEVQRESVSGVSLDEEMLNMIKYQQAYNACARVVTSIDEMLDTIISRMGIVGR